MNSDISKLLNDTFGISPDMAETPDQIPVTSMRDVKMAEMPAEEPHTAETLSAEALSAKMPLAEIPLDETPPTK